MSRLIYPEGFRKVNFTSDTIRVLLERSTSTYTPNIDHDFLDDFTGGSGVEITVASYARQSLASKAIAYDSTKNQVEYDAADVAFGNLESGQTVKSIIVYRQIGGDDTTPANDDLLLYDDGKIDVVLAATVSGGATSVWVQPIEANIPSGTAIDFGGGATATLSSAASRGARTLAISAIAAGATAGATASNVATDSILPAVLQNGPFTIQLHADGLIILTQRGLFAT
jgi:hypothetical protein